MQVHRMFKHITIGGDKLDGEREGIRIHGKVSMVDLVGVVNFEAGKPNNR